MSEFNDDEKIWGIITTKNWNEYIITKNSNDNKFRLYIKINSSFIEKKVAENVLELLKFQKIF